MSVAIERGRMKALSVLLAVPGLGGCASLTESPWAWLDDPDQQSWPEIRLHVPGREVSFRIPDRLKPGGEHVRRWKALEYSGQQQIELPPELLSSSSQRLAQFVWEWYWGGFYRRGNYDFSLDVWILRAGEHHSLLELNVDGRIQRQLNYFRRVYSGPRSQRMREYFFSRYDLRAYESSTGHIWVIQNQPQVTAEHEEYLIPISDRHELKFSFFIAEDRFGGLPDPDWMERRKKIARRIIDTVRIVPDPYPD